MYVIGERINGMFKDVRAAIKKRDQAAVQDLARRQLAAGATALDINVGPASAKPTEAMLWLVETVRAVADAPLCIDSPKWEVQEKVIPKVPGRKIINSSKADEAELDRFAALAAEHDAALVGLTIDQAGVPANAEKRVELGAMIASKAMEKGLPMEKLFIDPIILPVNVAPQQPGNVLAALSQLKLLSDPPPHLVLGLSNVSQNCSNRELINRTYLVMALAAGMDAAIMDPLDTELMNAAITTELLQGKAIYCDSFLDAHKMRR
jgi:5-methyltetrahydrofolate corrinoid/iron sulfur protein methyltransferase